MCSSHIFTCPRVTSYNLLQTAFLPGLTLPQKASEPGSPTDLLPCKNDFLAEMEESLAGEDGRGTEPKLRSWEQLRQSCRKDSKQLCVKPQLMLPDPSILFPLQNRTPQALPPPFLLHHHSPPAKPECCLLSELLGFLQSTTDHGGFGGKIFLGAGPHKSNKNVVLDNPCYM